MDCYMIRRGMKTIVYDSFNRSNGNLGTAESGQPWLTNGSATTAWVVSANKAKRASATENVTDVAYINCGKQDVIVSGDITIGSGSGSFGNYLVARMSGVSVDNSISFCIDSVGGIRIIKRIAGAATSLAVGTYSITLGNSYSCSLSCIGNKFSASINGVVVLTATDDNALKTNTIVGMFIPVYSAFSPDIDFIDNFTVKG